MSGRERASGPPHQQQTTPSAPAQLLCSRPSGKGKYFLIMTLNSVSLVPSMEDLCEYPRGFPIFTDTGWQTQSPWTVFSYQLSVPLPLSPISLLLSSLRIKRKKERPKAGLPALNLHGMS